MTIVETRIQPTRIELIQSFNAVITTTRVDIVVEPNTNVTKRGIIIRFVVNLDHALGRFSIGKKLNRSLRLPTTNTRVVGTPQMVFTNIIMTTHVHKTTYRPLMNLITTRGYCEP